MANQVQWRDDRNRSTDETSRMQAIEKYVRMLWENGYGNLSTVLVCIMPRQKLGNKCQSHTSIWFPRSKLPSVFFIRIFMSIIIRIQPRFPHELDTPKRVIYFYRTHLILFFFSATLYHHSPTFVDLQHSITDHAAVSNFQFSKAR